MRRIERGDQVRGISLKLQEEERERRMDFVPEQSAINTEAITVDPDTKDLLSKLKVEFAGAVSVHHPQRQDTFTRGPRGAPRQ
jgi:small subunit ribosomal protein S17e